MTVLLSPDDVMSWRTLITDEVWVESPREPGGKVRRESWREERENSSLLQDNTTPSLALCKIKLLAGEENTDLSICARQW